MEVSQHFQVLHSTLFENQLSKWNVYSRISLRNQGLPLDLMSLLQEKSIIFETNNYSVKYEIIVYSMNS